MSLSRSFPSFLLSSALLHSIATAQTAPGSAASPATAPSRDVQHLDKFVVSAGHDAKTSFDVAQGTFVLAGEELHRQSQSTLGETLSGTPGVSSTYYGPGASRPIIRGLGGDRVRVLDNGVGSLDASNISPDHNAAIEPLFASRIEVLRGPSTLLYGSSAIGGAVNVIDNSIPDRPVSGKPGGSIELRAGGAGRERAALTSLGGGTNQFAGHLNLLKQRTRDLRIPGFARIDADAPADQPRGTLPGSATDTFSGSLGGSVFWDAGRAGAAVSRYETDYGVPTGDDPGVSIRMRRTRLDGESEVTRPFGAFRSAKVRFGVGDYEHSELSGGTVENTRFTNRAWEGRLELPHVPVGRWSGMIGVQTGYSDFAARGEEAVTPPSETSSAALFAVEDFKLNDRISLQLGARGEGQSIRLGDVEPGLPALPGYAARSGQRKRFAGGSASLGVVMSPAKDWILAAAVTYSERLPSAQELFSNGPHGATGAYEVGSSGLGNERSLGIDLSVRRRAGFVTGSIGGFVNRFRNYIFERELPVTAVPRENNADGLTPFQFVASDARFYGGEADLLFHLFETERRRLHLELSADSVRARDPGTRASLPRMPPRRVGARLSFEDGRWHAVGEVRRAFAQTRVADGETSTGGYTLVNASVSYLIPGPRVNYELFARGRNLSDAEAREHTSFLKDFAPLPGRGVLLGTRILF